MLVGVFTAIKIFNWVGTLYKGAITFTAPFAYICGFLFFLVFGGMTGVAVATVSLDVHWQDTYFVVAHFHFIMVGAVIMGFLTALHYWFPKMFGRKYPENWALLAAGLIVLGFNATFIPAVPARERRHAPAVLRVPGALHRAQRGLHGGVVAAGLRLRDHRSSTWPSRCSTARSRAAIPGEAAGTSGTRPRRPPLRTSTTRSITPGTARVQRPPGGPLQGGTCNLAPRRS